MKLYCERSSTKRVDRMQDIPISLIRLDLLFESVAGLISLLVSRRASIAYRITHEYRLSDLSTGFLVLSASMFCRVIGTLYFFVILNNGGSERVILIVSIMYSAIKTMAYLLFLVATRPYLMHRASAPAIALVALPILLDPVFDIISTFILVIITLQTLLNLASSRSEYSLYVFLGFLSLLISHLSQLFATMPLRGYFITQVFQLIGVMLFLLMVYRAGRV